MKKCASLLMALMACAAHADVFVTNYSWLQIPDNVVVGYGSSVTPLPFNPLQDGIENIRWGNRFYPNRTMTAYGTNDYWGAVQLDMARTVTSVRVQLWTDSTQAATFKRMTVEGLPAGLPLDSTSGYANIGSYTMTNSVGEEVFSGGLIPNAASSWFNIPVTNGLYSIIRVRFNGTGSRGDGNADYEPGDKTGVGGPGFFVIEPFGDGWVSEKDVNYAHRQFGTAASHNLSGGTMWGNVTNLITGTIANAVAGANAERFGMTQPWNVDGGIKIDLGTPRPIGRSIIVNNAGEGCVTATFEYSNNENGPFTKVTAMSSSNLVLSSSGMLEYFFPEVTARYWRVVDGRGLNGRVILTQWMLFTGDRSPFRTGREIDVVDYNWLQVRPGKVTVSAGVVNADLTEGHDIVAASGQGHISMLRWGGFSWYPSASTVDGTHNGNTNYYAKVTLDKPRHVSKVRAQFWAPSNGGGASVTAFFIDGFNGTSWTQIGEKRYPSATTGGASLQFDETLSVTPGVYKAVRVRLMAGDYGKGTHGGPGILLVEPYGNGVIDAQDVNWANGYNFRAIPTTSGAMNFPRTFFNSGSFIDDDSLRTGHQGATWAVNSYAQIDFNTVREIDTVTILWNRHYYASSYKILASTNGIDFTEMVFTDSVNLPEGYLSATQRTYEPTKARYIRLTDVAGPNGYQLFGQMIVNGPRPLDNSGTLILIR